jgi:glutathione S-transferase
MVQKSNTEEDAVELYFAPLACSMATRIALYEAGAEAQFHQVDTKAKRTRDGADFTAINPLGQVPVLRTDDGELLTENQVILQYVADRYPAAGLAPTETMPRYRLQQWLAFIGTELHKLVFTPLLNRESPDGAKEFARQKATPRFDYLNAWLDGRTFLLDRFNVADAYLTTILNNWTPPARIDLTRWPAVLAYVGRMRERPAIARAFEEEMGLYREEQARRAAT